MLTKGGMYDRHTKKRARANPLALRPGARVAETMREYCSTHTEVYMRINIVLDDKLVKEAMKLTQTKTKREVVDLALREIISLRKRKNVLDLVGQDLIAPDYDVRVTRVNMSRGTR